MKITLHLGLHRTGTTALQRALGRGAEGLREAGVWFEQTPVVRPAVTYPLAAAELTGIGGGPARFRARARVRGFVSARAREGWARLVLSDEMLVGHLDGALTAAGPYPTAAARLSLLAEALAEWEVQAVTALREPAAWCASAWSFALSRRPQPPFDVLRAAALGAERGWSALATDIASAFPDPVFWRAETYAARPRRVHALMVGPEAVGAVHRIARPTNASMSGPAVDALRRIRAAGGQVDPDVLADLRRRWPLAEHGPFQPFSEAERLLLAQRHEAELAAIARAGMRVLA